MLIVKVDDLFSRNILAFETGTKADFDANRASTPNWLFIDQPNALHRSDIKGFMLNPTGYKVDENNNLRPR